MTHYPSPPPRCFHIEIICKYEQSCDRASEDSKRDKEEKEECFVVFIEGNERRPHMGNVTRIKSFFGGGVGRLKK